MKKRIKRIAPIQVGKMLAAIYGIFAIIFTPFVLLGSLASHKSTGAGVIFIIILPIFYVIFGFLGGAFGAIVYNVCARWLGGVEIEFENDAPSV